MQAVNEYGRELRAGVRLRRRFIRVQLCWVWLKDLLPLEAHRDELRQLLQKYTCNFVRGISDMLKVIGYRELFEGNSY